MPDVMPPYISGDTDEEQKKLLRNPSVMPPAYLSPTSTRDLAPQPRMQPPTSAMPPMRMEAASAPVSPTAGQPPAMPPMKLDHAAVPNAELASGAMPAGRMPAMQPPTPPVNPGQKRYEDLLAQGDPKLPWWKRALDVAGSMFPIGREIEAQIPGSPQNYSMKLNQAAVRAAKEQELTAGGQQNTQRQQAIEEEPGKVELNKRNVESEITARGDKDTSTLAKMGLTRDKDGNVVADEASPVYKLNQQKEQRAQESEKNLISYRQSMIDLNGAKEEVERAKNDPNSPAYQAAQLKLMMAQRAHDIAAANLGLHQQEFQNKLQEQDLVKPGGQAQSRGSAAQAALDVLPGLAALVKKNGSQMGAAMGRLNKGLLKLGDVNPEVAKLYGAMKSFYALQPAIHGFRNAEFVKDFETAIGTLERDPDAFLAGMEGLKPTMEAVATEGKTYRHRIVEGGTTPAPGAPATGGFAAWKKAQGR